MKEKLLKERNKTILVIIFLILTIIILIYIFINNLYLKPSGKENITTKLNTETDFLNWFIDFDNLYNKKVKSPKYSITKETFQEVNNFLNNKNSHIYYKDNIYHINEYTTLELDINTRSFRYIKYEKNNPIEINEVLLKNGKYYVQIINKDYIYKISFNKDKVSKDKKKNKENITLDYSIYNKLDFKWSNEKNN